MVYYCLQVLLKSKHYLFLNSLLKRVAERLPFFYQFTKLIEFSFLPICPLPGPSIKPGVFLYPMRLPRVRNTHIYERPKQFIIDSGWVDIFRNTPALLNFFI